MPAASDGQKKAPRGALWLLSQVRLEAVVEVGTVQPGLAHRVEGVRAFVDGDFLAVHVGHTDVDRRVFVERVRGTCADPEAVLIRNGDGTVLCRHRAVIEGDAAAEGPVVVVEVSGTQRNAVGIAEAFMLLEQGLAAAAGGFQLLELAPAGVRQAVVDGPLRRHFVVTGQFPHFRQVQIQ